MGSNEDMCHEKLVMTVERELIRYKCNPISTWHVSLPSIDA